MNRPLHVKTTDKQGRGEKMSMGNARDGALRPTPHATRNGGGVAGIDCNLEGFL